MSTSKNKKRWYKFNSTSCDEVRSMRDVDHMTWPKIVDEIKSKYGVETSPRTLRRMYHKSIDGGNKTSACSQIEWTPRVDPVEVVQYNGDDSVNVDKKMFLDPATVKDKDKILEMLGYKPSEWSIVNLRVTEWDAPSNDNPDKTCYSVRCLLKPKNVVEKNAIEFARDLAAEMGKLDLVCGYIPQVKQQLNDEYMMEIPPIELHYGKRVHTSDSGCNYDAHIAQNVFYRIFDEIIDTQMRIHCGTCLLVIGGDFFNAEANGMTTRGTPQDNDGRYMKLFADASVMYETVIEALAKNFNKVEVMLCVGNHAKAMEFNLYCVLRAYFRNIGCIHFSDCTLETQMFEWGKCGLFFNHGVEKLDKIAKTLPAEFRKDWSKFDYTELHVGHLHKEGVVEEGGITVRRISSPCATDYWHYVHRFVGAVPAHQCFVWGKNTGLNQINYYHVPSSYFKNN